MATTKGKLCAIGVVFALLVARMSYVHYERYKLMKELSDKYNTDSTPELSNKDVLNLLKDRGIDLTADQLKAWVGDVDVDKDGFDVEELYEVIDQFDDFSSWKRKGKYNIDVKTEISVSHFGFICGDFTFLIILVVAIYYGIIDNQALGKQVRRSGIATTLRVAAQKEKWQRLEQEKAATAKQSAELERKLADLKAGTPTPKDNEAVAKLEEELKQLQEKQAAAASELETVKANARKNLQEAHMHNDKLKTMQKLLKGVEAFKGAGTGKFSEQGAMKGFAGKVPSSHSLEDGGNRSGLTLEKEMFGFPSNNEMKFFEMGKLIASGADGAYRCRDIDTNEEHCVKTYKISDTRQKDSMLKDLQAKQKICDHKHIVRFQQVVEAEEKIYVMMELIPGQDILSRIMQLMETTRKAMNEKEAGIVLYQVCDALKFCHDNDIVHGDVKPENAMITGTDDKPIVKLIDFGFASFLGTVNEAQVSVRDKLSPPEARTGKPTKEGDCFRLGGMLYMMLVGTYPFRDDSCRQAGQVCPYPSYQALSDEAKDLITKLCVDRLSMDEAMKHPWLREAKENNPWLDETDFQPNSGNVESVVE